MRIDHQVVVFDAADLAAESTFWAGALDGEVDTEDNWHMVERRRRPASRGPTRAGSCAPGLARRDAAAADPPRPLGR